MRKQVIKLAAAVMTLPIVAACAPTPQERAASACIKERIPALHNNDGSFRKVTVEIAGGGNSVVLTSGSNDIGPLDGDARPVIMRAYDGYRLNPSNLTITVAFQDLPGDGQADDNQTADKRPTRVDLAPLSQIPGAEKESRIVRGCLEAAELLPGKTRPVQVAALMPR